MEEGTAVSHGNLVPTILTIAGTFSALLMLASFLIFPNFLQSFLFFILFILSLIFAWSAAIVSRLVHEGRRKIKGFVLISAIFITVVCVILGLLRIALGQ